ncbi:MAG: M14 family metallopeptidase [Polymorphobacter sp.]|uniref:M14 family metallopeptidase n=1 Tax=Polymorphobacter sp. TaxID=1909290 RepID=UPI003A8B3542
MRKAALPVLLLAALAGCATSSRPELTSASSAPPTFAFDAALAAAPVCQAPGLSVHAGFERAALAACTIGDDGHVHATIRAEAQPINPSPWYGMVIASQRPGETLLTLHYEGGKHRYQPWLATENAAPVRLEAARLAVAPDRTSATLRLPPAAASLVIAQPPETIEGVLAPFEARVRSGQLSRSTAGYSLDRRPLPVYHHRPAGARGTIVILTRQHPPETTGPQAFATFTDVLLGDSAPARALRQRHALMILPLVNPDGFAHGHWRQNRGGKDLNRDWGPFTQPETTALARAMEAEAKHAPILAVIDFHSTFRDVVYAPPLPDGPDLGQAMLAGIADDLAREEVRIDRAHNPGNGVLKSWAKDQFGVGALTWEVGDDSPPERTAALAEAAARALIASTNN